MSEFHETREFWNASPCGRRGSLEERKIQRYRMEPWLPEKLRKIAAEHADIVELGCGQGTDAMLLCSALSPEGSYLGIDYSDVSIEIARQEVKGGRLVQLSVTPEFRVGDAGALELDDESVSCIYSMGVLHHMEDERRAFREIRRILKPGGKAYLWLYRTGAPKVEIAKGLRLLQSVVDRLLGSDRALYRFFHRRHSGAFLGTMVLECFGVPHLKSYTRREVLELTSEFDDTRLSPVGYSLPWLHRRKDCESFFGYFWAIELRKS